LWFYRRSSGDENQQAVLDVATWFDAFHLIRARVYTEAVLQRPVSRVTLPPP
jgi:hypothetical protein